MPRSVDIIDVCVALTSTCLLTYTFLKPKKSADDFTDGVIAGGSAAFLGMSLGYILKDANVL